MHTLPAVARLKAAWPESRFSWLVNTEWAPLLAGNPALDEVILFPRQQFRGPRGWLGLARWSQGALAGRRPDLALDFQGLLRSALLGRASRPAAFFGMSDAREGARFFYDQVVPVPGGAAHAVDRYLTLTEGVLGAAAAPVRLEFPLPEGEAPGEGAGIPPGVLVLHPFARGRGKSLTPAQVETMCRRLAPRRVVLVGKGGGHPLELPPSAVDLLDRTSLPELIWILRRAGGVISVDSGPAHLAAALGKPLVAVHTWSDPRRVGPYRDDAWVWKSGRLLPMKEIRAQDDAFFARAPRPPGTADIEAICERAISLSSSCA